MQDPPQAALGCTRKPRPCPCARAARQGRRGGHLQLMRGLAQQPEAGGLILEEVHQRAGGLLGEVEADQALLACGVQLHAVVRAEEPARAHSMRSRLARHSCTPQRWMPAKALRARVDSAGVCKHMTSTVQA